MQHSNIEKKFGDSYWSFLILMGITQFTVLESKSVREYNTFLIFKSELNKKQFIIFIVICNKKSTIVDFSFVMKS